MPISNIPFSKIGCIVTTTTFLYQVLYAVPEQQRQIKIIKKHLNIIEESPRHRPQSNACPMKNNVNQEYWMEMRKYND
jgi:hypothetical protein